MKKKNKAPDDWSYGWLAASFMSTAATLGIIAKPVGHGDDDRAEQEVTAHIESILISCGILASLTAAVLPPVPPSGKWRYIGVVRTEFGPVTCMLEGRSPEALLEQATTWSNHFKQKYDRATRLMNRLDSLKILGHTSRKRKERRRSEDE
jgi:hypothetical protein